MLEKIKELRAKTHLGMTVCKQALDQFGDVDKAIDHLMKQGTLKKASEVVEAKEGVVSAVVCDNYGLIIEVLCQTDFAARSELFKNLISDFLKQENIAMVGHEGKTILGFDFPKDKLSLCQKQLGETIVVKRCNILNTENGKSNIITSYNHHSGKIAVLLLANCSEITNSFDCGDSVNPKILEFLDECTMQIAANNPFGLNREDIASEEIKQREIFAAQVPAKAEKMKEKIIQGKIDKWYSDVVLMDQESIIHSKKTISQLKTELEAGHGEINLVSFVRYELGQ